MTLGYGIIPKLAMQDKRLSIEAKAIYSYFCSFAGHGSSVFPSRRKILNDLNISEERYYKHFNQLKIHGYIKTKQSIDSTGKYKNNIYTLVEMIPFIQQKESNKPYPQNPCTENPCAEIPCTENKGTNNNSINNNNYINNNSNKSIYQDDSIEKTISTNISLDSLLIKYKNKAGEIIELYKIIIDTVKSNKKSHKVSREYIEADRVRETLLKLDSGHIEYIIECLSKNTTEIKNTKSYLLTVLYNAGLTINNYYSLAVQHTLENFA